LHVSYVFPCSASCFALHSFPTRRSSDLVSYQHLRQAQLRAVEAGLPLLLAMPHGPTAVIDARGRVIDALAASRRGIIDVAVPLRSEEHTSELQSRENLVCRLLLEKKNLH